MLKFTLKVINWSCCWCFYKVGHIFSFRVVCSMKFFNEIICKLLCDVLIILNIVVFINYLKIWFVILFRIQLQTYSSIENELKLIISKALKYALSLNTSSLCLFKLSLSFVFDTVLHFPFFKESKNNFSKV